MKLYELLETANKSGDMVVRDGHEYAIRYCEKINGFAWCYRNKNGQYSLDTTDKTGYKRVFLNDNLLDGDWYLEPIKRIEPIQINGTKFTDYDKAIQYLNKLKDRNDTLELCKRVYKSTGIKPHLIADAETIEYINNELYK